MRKISLIIPCYNEESCLLAFDQEMSKIVEQMQEYEFEILYVDDGSKDHTLEVIRQIAQNRSYVRYLSFSRNFGKESAMYAGFCNVTGDYIAVMDADLQDPPGLLPDMVRILETGEYDSVATRRVDRAGEPPIRSFFARIFYKMINKISDADIVDGARDYRLMKREMVDVIVEMGERNRFSKGIFGWIGFRTYWYAFENVERAAGETKWSFWKLLKYSIDGIVSFSQVPLNIASWMGVACTGLSLLAILFIIVRKLVFGDAVQGWASNMCVMLFIGGVQLFCMGVMGQYIGKTYAETKKRPHYIVSECSDDQIKKIG
ncbi:MAG: glycosyltransferase family 2 protein [Lachnospiraceae bacterium]|nr:glycosyltransferase family 2 protein [Lachnospiraceae bacterium]